MRTGRHTKSASTSSQLVLIPMAPVKETALIHSKENNHESQAILDANRKRLHRQGKLLFRMMMADIEVTAISAAAGIWFEGEKHFIGDVRTRMSEWRRHKPVRIAFQEPIYEGRFKKFFMSAEDKAYNKINFPYYL